MLKYLQNVINDLKQRLAGIKLNADKWTNQPITATEIEADLKVLEDQQAKIMAAESTLQKEREEGRRIELIYLQKVKQIDNLAMGIHAKEKGKLIDYGISQRKNGSSKPIPGKCVITNISIEADGEGFVVTWDVVPTADHYEIERGIAPNATDMVLAPPYHFLKTTSKTVLTDDNIIKGSRYFYRVRAINATGSGEWSEPVNRVQ